MKNLIAFFIFLPVIFTFDVQSNLREVLILLLSGIIGISLGDSFYITSLRALGTRRTLAVEALSPIIATILGSALLHEMLSLKVWLGIIIASISLIGVAIQKTEVHSFARPHVTKAQGFIFAFLSILCAVTAATLSRYVLTNSDLNPFQTTEIRLLGGIIALIPFAKKYLIKSVILLPFREKSRIFYATLLGTNIGILLQQNVFKLLPIGLGWTLLSTSPAIAIFFARAEGEDLNWKTIALTIMVIIGLGISFI